ncbi:hypothetical protein KQI65_08775 [bacterium]|nr:hypothetical protein [bacterium]
MRSFSSFRRVSLHSLISLLALCFAAAAVHAQTFVTVDDSVLVKDVRRFGINVGSRSQWGAAQFMKNLIDNPGFEAGRFASVVLAEDGASVSLFPMAFWDPAWNNDQYGVGWPEDFWDGAEYEIVWGAAKGRSGQVTDFSIAGGQNVFTLDGSGAAPGRLDVMLLRGKDIPGFGGNTSVADATTVRPGSPGRQSLRLTNGGYVYRFYMDSLWRDGDRSAGKLLVINGQYHFSIWAKAAAEGDELRVRFFREGEANFLDERIALTTEWQHIERNFFVAEGADPVREYTEEEYHPILGFQLEASSSGSEVWVDDVELYSTEDQNPTVFTDSYVDRLMELHPGILRYWGGQLGASLDDQLAAPFARRTHGYSPRTRNAGSWPYSLHEFLELCDYVDADPWYVMPPTFAREEIEGLVEYLAAPATAEYPRAMQRAAMGHPEPWTRRFTRMHIEYGNELWGAASGGDPFMGASVNGGVRLGNIASDRFDLLRAAPHFDGSTMTLVIGGQAGYAGRQREIVQNSSSHDAVALAPYFGVLDSWSSDEEIFLPLFAAPIASAATGGMHESRGYLDEGGGTGMSIYEINFHTTHGNAPIDVRNDYLTGAGGAIALPLSMLVYQRDLAVRDQCAFSSLQYSFRLENGDMARLWGMLRDVEATGRKRPTWLGVELVNHAIKGNAMRTTQSGENPTWLQESINGVGEETLVEEIQSFAFADGKQWSLVLFNLSLDTPHRVEFTVPGVPNANAHWYSIEPASIHDDNEDSTTIVIDSTQLTDFYNGFSFELQPHTIHVFTWENEATSSVSIPLPGEYALSAYSSAGSVRVHYALPRTQHIRLDAYDLLGRHIHTLADRETTAGQQQLTWQPGASGTYLLVMRSAEGMRSVRVVSTR